MSQKQFVSQRQQRGNDVPLLFSTVKRLSPIADPVSPDPPFESTCGPYAATYDWSVLLYLSSNFNYLPTDHTYQQRMFAQVKCTFVVYLHLYTGTFRINTYRENLIMLRDVFFPVRFFADGILSRPVIESGLVCILVLPRRVLC